MTPQHNQIKKDCKCHSGKIAMKNLDYYMNLPYKLELTPDGDEGGYFVPIQIYLDAFL